jgi:NitT/TauT family transport system substrate-binding protein
MIGRFRLAAAVLAGVLLAAGCASGSGTSASGAGGSGTGGSGTGGQTGKPASGGAGAVTNLTVGTSPTLSNASLFLASEGGTFAKNKLSVTTQVMTSGAQAIPLLLNGQIQFTAADPVAAIVAISRKVPLVIVAQGNVVPADPAKDASGLLVRADSGISTAQDLAGKTVAVNSLGSLAQIGTEQSIDAAGGDASKVKFVELPIPQMVAAVKGGQVNAAVPSEPYVTQGKQAGLKDIMPVLSKSLPGAPMLVYLASQAFVASHPDVVRAFAASITAANTTLSTDVQLIREVGAKSTPETPALLAKIVLPTFVSSGIDLGAVRTLMDAMVKYKILQKPVDVGKYVFTAQ